MKIELEKLNTWFKILRFGYHGIKKIEGSGIISMMRPVARNVRDTK